MVVVLRHTSRGHALLQEVYQYAVLINTLVLMQLALCWGNEVLCSPPQSRSVVGKDEKCCSLWLWEKLLPHFSLLKPFWWQEPKAGTASGRLSRKASRSGLMTAGEGETSPFFSSAPAPALFRFEDSALILK